MPADSAHVGQLAWRSRGSGWSWVVASPARAKGPVPQGLALQSAQICQPRGSGLTKRRSVWKQKHSTNLRPFVARNSEVQTLHCAESLNPQPWAGGAEVDPRCSRRAGPWCSRAASTAGSALARPGTGLFTALARSRPPWLQPGRPSLHPSGLGRGGASVSEVVDTLAETLRRLRGAPLSPVPSPPPPGPRPTEGRSLGGSRGPSAATAVRRSD